MLLNESRRDKVLHALETKHVSRLYRGGHNAWRRIAGVVDSSSRTRRIAALGQASLDGLTHQETNLGWVAPDRFERFPVAPQGRHRTLAQLHAVVRPRTYLEIGIDNGASLHAVQVPAIGVDPAPQITYDLGPHIAVARDRSDDFFARTDALAHLGGVPLDLAFIDGMHLSEFALRDFMNLEKLMPPTGVIVFDDMLPRNSLEAYRVRRTNAWAGDVYKVTELLEQHRPDLVVLPLNTNPTGTVLVTNLDPGSRILDERYEELEAYCTTPDPQVVSPTWTQRLTARDPRRVVDSPAWAVLRDARSREVDLDAAMTQLRAIPPLR